MKLEMGVPKGFGVYISHSGTMSRVTFVQNEPVFEQHIIFPDDDHRLEYRGKIKDINVMNGEGVLSLKNGSIISDTWVDGVSKKHEAYIQQSSENFQMAIADKEARMMRLKETKK